MKRSRFSDEQIIGILKEHQAGLSAIELCHKCGVSDATFYKWRSKYGGMEVAEAKRLKALEDENGKLKRLLADAMLDVSTLKGMLGVGAGERHAFE
jgi:putative transposase